MSIKLKNQMTKFIDDSKSHYNYYYKKLFGCIQIRRRIQPLIDQHSTKARDLGL